MKMDDRNSTEYQNWEKKDINVIFRKVFKSQNEQYHLLKWAVLEQNRGAGCWLGFFKFFLEREPLLSKNTANPIVGSLQDKKGSCSMQSGLRVGTRFVSF